MPDYFEDSQYESPEKNGDLIIDTLDPVEEPDSAKKMGEGDLICNPNS
jgi:hypothetical protein